MNQQEYQDKTALNKLAVCITFHYVEERLKYLAEVCDNLVEIAPIINLTIVTNVKEEEKIEKIKALVNQDKIDLEFLIPHGLGHPYLLAWSHLDVFRKKIEDETYSHFLYLEDDIKITRENTTYWLEARQKLKKHGFIPGFFRIERNDHDGNFYSSDVMEKMSMYDCPVFNAQGETSFINIVYPYQGLYLLDRELMNEHLNGPSSNPDFDHSDGGLFRIQGHDMRARAAFCLTFVNVPSGFRSRYVLPFNNKSNQIESYCFVHHLPNNYTNNLNHNIGKIKVTEVFIPRSIVMFLKKKAKTITSSLIASLFSLDNNRKAI